MKALSPLSSKSLAQTDLTFASVDECKRVLAAIAQDETDLCSQALAADAVTLIMELFPPREIGNPETFLEFAVMSLVGFPSDVVAKLAHPQFGIARDCKWLPSISELVQWCEREMEARKAAKANATKRLAVLRHREQLSRGNIINEQRRANDGWHQISYTERSQPKEDDE